MTTRIVHAVIAVLVLSGSVLLGSLAVDESAGAAAETTEMLVRPPSLSDAIDAYASRLQVGRPQRYANLTIFPVFADGVIVPPVGLALDKALKQGLLDIVELDRAEVNRVRLRSCADEPIFIMGGEMLLGAKQDRIVGHDLVVPPGADLVVPVYCVEQGRWVAKTDTFSSAGALVAPEVRKARQQADQGAVWSRVAEEQSRLGAQSETGAFRSIQESEQVQDKLRPYVRALSDFAADHPRARGAVACVGTEIIAADLFGSRSLFLTLWPKLLESYVIDVLDRPGPAGHSPDAVRIKKWLIDMGRAERSRGPSPGAGTLWELRGREITGSALVYEEGVVHVELFKRHHVRPLRFNRLQFRRERLEEDEEQTIVR